MNPWDDVNKTRSDYERCIADELRTHESYLANPNNKDKRHLWHDAMQRKGKAYIAYMHAIGAAVKSGIPCPW